MTTYADQSVTCYVCGKPSTHAVLASTNAFGSPDLDLRPPEMRRSTMRAWVQCCPTCGYCQSDLGRESPGARALVAGAAYRAALADEAYPRLARHFRCQSLLQEAAGDARAAAQSSLRAAWSCDDAGHDAGAIACRERAIELLLRSGGPGGEGGAGESPERVATSAAMLADLMRRAGRFDESVEQCDRGLAALASRADRPEVVAHVLHYQRKLAAARDRARHTVADALASEAPELIGDKGQAPGPAAPARQPPPAKEKAAVDQEAHARHQKVMARWRRIVADGWACTHCGRTGLADKDFRLSVGAATVILCRACGWPQEGREE